MSRRATGALAMLHGFAILGVGVTTAAKLAAQDAPVQSGTAIVSGTVKDAVSAGPIRIASVRVAGSSTSTITDDAGRFHIAIAVGPQTLEVRRIGYRPATVSVEVVVTGVTIDVKLTPIPVGLDRVLINGRDDAARRIIAAAIRRKQEKRGTLHDFRYDGDVRLVVRDLTKPANGSSQILAMTETKTSAYWEPPNRYQETIVARRQTGNVVAQRNLVGVGRILDFSSDRVQLGRFELASPIADDALDRYDYHVLDTLAVDGRRVFRLSLEPIPDGSPAFAGIIDIADSTFDVMGIDVGVNNAVRLGLLRNVRYQQRYGDAGGRWMPFEIELTADIKILGPAVFRLQHLAVLSGYRFDEGKRPAGLGEYRIVVADSADRTDSATWSAADRSMPRTPEEQVAWTRIDSVAHTPLSPGRQVLRAGFVAASVLGNPDFFHFNRVDGVYVGAGWTWLNPAVMPGTEPTLKLGHAAASDLWQYRVGDQFRLSESQRMWIGATYHDETVSRPTFTSTGYNPTIRALFSRIDPLDYYRERGVVATFTMKLIDFVRFDGAYTDARQSSLPLAVTKPLFGGFGRDTGQRAMRPNDPINDGYLRAFSAGVAYDSRQMLHQAGRDTRLGAAEWTRIGIDAEVAPGSAIGSDFDYQRYVLRFDRRQQSFGMGVTTFLATAGVGTVGLPVQRMFTIDGGAQILDGSDRPFVTLLDSSFTAPRAALIAVSHDFDRLLFTKSRIPLVRDIPFTFAIRGGVFWTSFGDAVGGRIVTSNPYREVGFSIGNLTPFLSPFNLTSRFAWQLSRYPTSRFRFSLGFGQ